MQTFLEIDHISKTFPGVKALSDVHFDIYPGEVHSLVGENGAGKSTLIKIMSGVPSSIAVPSRPEVSWRIIWSRMP